MGLLSRAGRQEAGFALDEMGKALRERLGRLPQKKSTPYTALTLLKAYGAFQTGFCLSLTNGIYLSYASVGLGIEKLSIPKETVWSIERTKDKYFKLDPEKSITIKNSEKDFIYWVFPLAPGILPASPDNTASPWEAIMILGVSNTSGFNPEPVSAILDEVADIMVLPVEKTVLEPASPDSQSGETAEKTSFTISFESDKPAAVEEAIAQFNKEYLDFSCIVLENPGENADFCKKVTAMIDKAGAVIPLPSGRPLILFPLDLDRELIAHRLTKTLKTGLLLSFEANNPENVSTRIDSLM